MPGYQRLAETLREQIRSGDLRPGARVPGAPELSREHQVSRTTAQMALRMLQNERLIVAARGLGTFVRSRDDGLSARAEAHRLYCRSTLCGSAGSPTPGEWCRKLDALLDRVVSEAG